MITGADPALLRQCLDLCQALASKGQEFNLNLSHTGTSFTFSLDTRRSFTLDTREEVNLQKKMKKKKRDSPSNKRRNQKRKEEFLRRKTTISAAEADKDDEETPVHPDTFKCDLCEKFFNTENGLRIHKGKAHKCVLPPSIEKLLNSPEKVKEKEVSPAKESKREEVEEEKEQDDKEPLKSFNPDMECDICGWRSDPMNIHPKVHKLREHGIPFH